MGLDECGSPSSHRPRRRLLVTLSYWQTPNDPEDYSKDVLKNMRSQTRTSSSCMLRPAQTSIVERIEHRLAALSGLRLEELERLNMVRYALGEYFSEHHDGKFRSRTIFVYLNDLPEGDTGDTFFRVLNLRFRPRTGCAVMWENRTTDGKEDARVLHEGLPPQHGVKYGVNCFFNVSDIRLVHQPGPYSAKDAVHVDVRDLSADDADGGREAKLRAFVLKAAPKIVAVPMFASAEEVEHLVCFADRAQSESQRESAKEGCSEPAPKGTETLHIFGYRETEVVSTIESRLTIAGALANEHLGRLRLVSPGTTLGLCNRGCGPKSGYVCLSQSEEVLFPKLGMRVLMRAGDLLLWANVDWETGKAVEDMQTLRVHLECRDPLGVDVFFHDTPIRKLQSRVEDEV